MSKKKPKAGQGREREPELPKFGGFQPLAGMLGDLKSKVDAEKKKEEEARKAAGKPLPPPPPPPRANTAPRAPDPREGDDDLAFHRMMSGVTPLAAKNTRVAVAGDARVAAAKVRPTDVREKAAKDATAVLEHLHSLVDDGVRFEVTDDGRRVEGRRLDASPQLVRELRRGSLPIDGRLDLHGLAAGDAREKLLEFLRTMRSRGERCVLVIHGKGDHSPGGGIGVLRGEISAWLSQGRAREHVAAFATAHADDGGEGAVYVALRR